MTWGDLKVGQWLFDNTRFFVATEITPDEYEFVVYMLFQANDVLEWWTGSVKRTEAKDSSHLDYKIAKDVRPLIKNIFNASEIKEQS